MRRPNRMIDEASRRLGNALSEYSLIAGVMLLGSLGSLMLLEDNIQSSLQAFQDSLKPQTQSKQGTRIIGSTYLASDLYSSGVITFTTSSGTGFQLQNYPQDIDLAIQTIGSNGATEIILANLNNLIQRLLQAGEITQPQADLLTALSNQGHEIARVEALLEAAQANSNTRAGFLSTPIVYNGQTYTPELLAQQIGAVYVGTDLQFGSQLKRFKELNAQANAQGVLNDPVANQLVNLMSEQIIAIANGLESGISRIKDEEITVAESKASDPKVLDSMHFETPVSGSLQKLASTHTHQNSGTICSVGRGRDSGTACSSELKYPRR